MPPKGTPPSHLPWFFARLHIPETRGLAHFYANLFDAKLLRRGVTTVNLLVVFALSACVVFGKTIQTSSDPYGSLLVSQEIIEHGTIQLDQYQQQLGEYKFQFKSRNGHFYYYFPLGTSLVAIPFVAAAQLFGADMAIERHQRMTQLFIAAVALLLSFLVTQGIARLYLEHFASACLSAALVFGTSFVSTGMTGLWSHDFAALFALLAIFALLKAKTTDRPVNWQLMAVFLFMAYLCRPPLLLLAVTVVAIQFIFIDKKSALKLVLALLLLAAAFMAFSWREFNQLLPDYYLPTRLAGQYFWRALYGNLASPARGLFVYSPFLLLPVLAVPFLWQKYPAYRAELSLVIWPVLHLLAISKFPQWWAGYAYGSRLMYDALPGLFVLLVIFWRVIDHRSIAARVTIVLALFAVTVNFGQGIFNRYTQLWNAAPSIDNNPEFVFHWKYPQFLHSAVSHRNRIAEVQALESANLDAAKAKLTENEKRISYPDTLKLALSAHRVLIGEQYGVTSDALIFLNWYAPEKEFRSSAGYYSEIVFMPDVSALSSSAIHLELKSFRPQTIHLLVNGRDASARKLLPGEVSIDIDIRGELKRDEINTLQFQLPGARRASVRDPRMLSIALKSIAFCPGLARCDQAIFAAE